MLLTITWKDRLRPRTHQRQGAAHACRIANRRLAHERVLHGSLHSQGGRGLKDLTRSGSGITQVLGLDRLSRGR